MFAMPAEAQPILLATNLESEVIELIQEMGPDSWEEANVEAQIDGVFYDQNLQIIIIAYETRELDSSQPFQKQPPLIIPGISSLKDIVQVASNGFRSLNEKIANQILETI